MSLFVVLVLVFVVLAATPLRGVMIKPGAISAGIRPELFPGIAVVRQVYVEHGYEFWLTSGIEGKHGFGSLHPLGLASDFRVADPGGAWSIPLAEREQMEREIKERTRAISTFYHVRLEVDHIHLEYDDGVTKRTHIFS